jgi:hypothetical protein
MEKSHYSFNLHMDWMGIKFYETRSYINYMRHNPLRDMCTCTNFEAHVTHVLCFKIRADVCFKIYVGTHVM